MPPNQPTTSANDPPPAASDPEAQNPPSSTKTSSAFTATQNASSQKKKLPRPRWLLHLQAQIWRFLMSIGMLLHRLAPPRPPRPAFTHTIKSTLSGKPGEIGLLFYTPMDYATQKKLWSGKPLESETTQGVNNPSDGAGQGKRASTGYLGRVRKASTGRKWGTYPVVINFHGGGFTLGAATDDARWCGTVVDECNAVVVSVEYRKAPEFPFPTPVEDGVDAVIWVHKHAEALGIDRDRIALSGFSSGANMAFTVPLRLYDEITGFARDDLSRPMTAENEVGEGVAGKGRVGEVQRQTGESSSATSDTMVESSTTTEDYTLETLDPKKPAPPDPAIQQQQQQNHPGTNTDSKPTPTTATTELDPTPARRQLPNIRIRCLIPWYPSTDYTRTREERRATTLRKDQELPALFTNLFDESYLHPPDSIALDSPYLSPGVASQNLLSAAIPRDIILHCCEWDMLLAEGLDFKTRLESECGKNISYRLVEGVPHGWDKAPNPLKPTPGVKEYYLRACKQLRGVLNSPGGLETAMGGYGQGRERDVGLASGTGSAAPRDSVSVVR
ncbi:hypothetical protein MBLNU230_g8213t1 [Neophaeotheca triangularis]